MAERRHQVAFVAFTAPAKDVLIVFCEEGLKIGPASRKSCSAPTGDLLAAGCQGGPLQRQERKCVRPGRPRGSHGVRLVVVGVGKAGRVQAAGCPQAWRSRPGRAPGAARQRDNRRGTAVRHPQVRSHRRSRARHPPSRLQVRPLQDQAQGRREAAGAITSPPSQPQTLRARGRPTLRERRFRTVLLLTTWSTNRPMFSLPEEFARRASALRKLHVFGRSARHQGHGKLA